MANAAPSIHNIRLSYMGTSNTVLDIIAHPGSREKQLLRKEVTCIAKPQALDDFLLSGPLDRLHVHQSHMHNLRKDGRERDWRLQNPSYDGISYAPSFGDLSSVCTGDMSPALDFASYLGLSVSYPDFPPRYDECVGPGTSGSYLPTDEPPPYSLEDPQQLPRELALSDNTEEIALRSLDNTENDLITPSLSAADLHDVSPSRTTSKTSQHLPIIPMDIQKSMASSTTLAS
ncbi:PREDICTED: protein BEAN1 isoform X3 [Nanorana parkeri]|uniref:protein BEAN1 isoform X3 n=1 Tax=Nanorana parkeri TaxID=125878 RepID=UPI0008542D94|nr:PREDICTED: protein BEAN1 isoform X3 [Nanorana parkeri]